MNPNAMRVTIDQVLASIERHKRLWLLAGVSVASAGYLACTDYAVPPYSVATYGIDIEDAGPVHDANAVDGQTSG